MAGKNRRFFSASKSLVENAISSLLTAIEIYNKPNVAYRQETTAILLAHAWELFLKWALYKNKNKRVIKYIRDGLNEEPTEMIWFDESIALYCIWKENHVLGEHLKVLNKNRNRIMHAYVTRIETDVFYWWLFQKSFELFSTYIKKEFWKFRIPWFDSPLLLPIWFGRLTNKELFLNAFNEQKTPIYNDLVEASRTLNWEWISDLVIVPITTVLDKKLNINNSDLLIWIDNNSDIQLNVKKTITLSEKGQTLNKPIDLNTLRSKFNIPASILRKEMKLYNYKAEPERQQAYQWATSSKYHEIYWWKDPDSWIKFLCEEAKQQIENFINQQKQDPTCNPPSTESPTSSGVTTESPAPCNTPSRFHGSSS